MGIFNSNLTYDTDSSFRPIIFRGNIEHDFNEVETLIKNNPNIKVSDSIELQIGELIKCRYPKIRFHKDLLDKYIEDYTVNSSLDKYGVWVYYSWNNSLVHCLPEEEFIEVRTNRNKYKITHNEQCLLAGKSVGVIGLSVGQSVAVTLAMERSCGELRIADFDTIDLSNLNRIRTGIHNIGIPKTVVVAREIAEIDPFLKVTCFHEGINETNLKAFLTTETKLDILIDECDNIGIKIKCRSEARSLGIPVVMDTSDRGMIDVERFDLEPNRPVFHGLVSEQDVENIDTLTTDEEKLKLVFSILNLEKVSKRGKASLLEIKETLNTWPQLASDVVMGGGKTAQIARQIALGEHNTSGRFYFDDEQVQLVVPVFDNKEHPLVHSFVEEVTKKLVDTLPQSSLQLNKKQLDAAIEAIQSAPSSGNDQPWFWHYYKGRFTVYHDKHVADCLGNPNYYGSLVSIGGAIENLKQFLKDINLGIEITYSPNKDCSELIALITIVEYKYSNNLPSLANTIPKRFTSRKIGNGKAVSEQIYSDINLCVEEKNYSIDWISSKEKLKKLGEIIGEFDRIRLLNKRGNYDFFQREIRWDRDTLEATSTGMHYSELNIPDNVLPVFDILKDPSVISLLKKWDKGAALEKITALLIASSDRMGLISVKNQSERTELDFLKIGELSQEIWLYTNSNKIAFQPIIGPLYFFESLTCNAYLDELEIKRIKELEIAFNTLFNLKDTDTTYYLFRVANTDEVFERKSIRKSVDKIFKHL